MIMLGSIIAQSPIIVEESTLFERIISFFTDTGFTIVGQDVGASVNADETWEVQPGTVFNRDADTYCSSGHGLFNVFVDNYVPRFEMKDFAYFNCGSQNDRCLVELYCMPHDFCSSDSQCESWVGSGSECNTKNAVDPYMPLIDASTGNNINSYTYCTSSCTGSDMNCWRIIGSQCEKRTYGCGYETYPNCPSSYSYTSLGECENDLPSNGNGVCTTNWDCTSWSECISGQQTRTCTDLNNCGTIAGKPSESQVCNGGGNPNFQVDILSVSPNIFSSDQDVDVVVKITNTGEAGTMKVETGLYKDEDITSWGFVISGIVTNCEPNEMNVQTRLITLNSGEETTETFTFITPRVCRPSTTSVNDFDVLSLAFVNCKNTGLAVGVTSSDRFAVMFTPRDDCTGSCTNGIRDGEETDTDCGGSECNKCGIGWKCERTTDCESGACIENYCSPGGEISGNQKGISASEIKKMTAEDLAASACTKSVQCEEGSECQSLQFLIDKGTLTNDEAESLIDKSSIFFGAAGAVGGVGACGALAGLAVGSLVLAPAAPILFPLCAIAGGALGLGINDIWENFGNKELSNAGYCIKEGGGLEIFEWAAWFDITGDGVKNGIDGLIIIIIGGALLLVLIRR